MSGRAVELSSPAVATETRPATSINFNEEIVQLNAVEIVLLLKGFTAFQVELMLQNQLKAPSNATVVLREAAQGGQRQHTVPAGSNLLA